MIRIATILLLAFSPSLAIGQSLGWWNLQWPPDATIQEGQTVTVYAQVWGDGITEAEGPNPDVQAWIGVSSEDTNPSGWTTWIPADYNAQVGNNDEYQAAIGSGLAEGTYYYASRFQYQAEDPVYGGTGGPWNNDSGVLTVEEAPPPPEDMWANIQFPEAATIAEGGSAMIFAQVFVDGVTDAPGQGAGVQGWIGYSTSNTDPATWTDWVVADYNADAGNNDEYAAELGATLAPGKYYYASRFQHDGDFVYGGVGGVWEAGVNESGRLYITTITVNGFADDPVYEHLGDWTQGDGGFGDFGLVTLRAHADGTLLYVALEAVCEDNFNDCYLFINNIDNVDGVPEGTQLPAGSDGASPFAQFRPTMDFMADYGLRLTSGSGEAYVSIVNYRNGGNTDTFLGTVLNDGTVHTVNAGPYAGTQIAYRHAGTLTNHDANRGWEIAIPLSVVGGNAGSEFQFLALYGNNDYISAMTIPEIPGQGSTHLGSNPDFSQIPGNQHTTPSPLPVVLGTFEASVQDSDVLLSWTTLSERNASGFDVQSRRAGSQVWTSQAFIEATGYSLDESGYSYRMVDAGAGTISFRLRMVDRDGSVAYSPEVEVSMEIPGEFVLESAYPNPFNPATMFRFGVAAEQHVTVTLFDLLGREVQMLFDALVPASELQTVRIDGAGLSSGTYLIHVAGERFAETRSVTLIK